MKKNKKLSSILWGVAYFAILVCFLVSGCIIFHNNYYSFIYVDGTSMTPTLNANGKIEFGIVDNHKNALNNIKRFDIVTTYYPKPYDSSIGYTSDYSYVDENGVETFGSYGDTTHDVKVSSFANYKIKRIIGLPGDEFRVTTDSVMVKTDKEDGENVNNGWEIFKFPFTHGSYGDKTNANSIVLGEDEYWVIGDNWGGSIDSKSLNMTIHKENIQGVLIAIEGTCQTRNKNGKVEVYNKKYYSKFKVFKR